MKKIKKSTIILILVSAVVLFSNAAFAGNSSSFSVSCRVPAFITLASGERALAETQEDIIEPMEDQELVIEDGNEDLIELNEEVNSGKTDERIIVVTVCPR